MNPQEPMQPQQQSGQPPYGQLPTLNQQPPQGAVGTAQPAPAQPQIEYINGPSSQEREEYSIDYLNRIAPKEQKAVNKFAVIGLIGGVLIAVVFAFILMTSSGAPSPNAQLAAVSGRVATLQSVVTEQQTHLGITQLSEANASLGSSLGTMNTDVTAMMKERKIKTDSAVASKEASYKTKLAKTLDDAYQKGTLDRTYTTQMTYELTVLRSKIANLKKSTTSKSIKEFCDTSTSNVDLILKVYASVDTSKS